MYENERWFFYQRGLKEYYNYSLISTCKERSWYFLDIFWETIVIVRLLHWRNTTIIHQFLLPQKGLNILRKDSDFKAVDLYKTRNRYTVIESLDLTANISWLASYFLKIKKPNKHCSGNQSVIAGVHILTRFHIFILK